METTSDTLYALMNYADRLLAESRQHRSILGGCSERRSAELYVSWKAIHNLIKAECGVKELG